jgi:hypothetical protein
MTMTAAQTAALNAFVAACDGLILRGFNVVACTSLYTDDAHFSTRFSLTNRPEADVTEDHILLDSIREIMVQWHGRRHDSDLVFIDR